jgi:hypothetical protein
LTDLTRPDNVGTKGLAATARADNAPVAADNAPVAADDAPAVADEDVRYEQRQLSLSGRRVIQLIGTLQEKKR